MQWDDRNQARPVPPPSGDDRVSLTDLFHQLADESRELLRHEKELARLEIQETARVLVRDAVKIGIGAGLAVAGGLALTAFLILVLGNLFNGAFWASALLVGAVFLVVGGLVAAQAIRDIQRRDLKPEQTIETLRQDQRWLKQEAREFRRGITS